MKLSSLLGLRAWLSGLFVAAIALTVIAYGSVHIVPLNISAFTFAALAGVSAAFPIAERRVRRVQTVAILLLAGLLGYAYLQTLPVDGSLANKAWKAVNENIGPIEGSISVAPGMTLEALASLALPFLVFVSGLAYFQGDGKALVLWRALAYFGVAYAVYGLVQETFFPQQLLFVAKKVNVGALTASLVDPDHVGTFFGVALMVNLGLAFYKLRKLHIKSFIDEVFNHGRWRYETASVLIHALFSLIVAVALFLTKSRGAVGATFVACVVAVAILVSGRLTADKPSREPSRGRRFAVVAGSVVIIVLLFALLAGRTEYRIETQVAEEGRWCAFASTIQAIKDNWILGTGFGTFQDVFPSYRNSDCAGIFGIWDKAHNVFLEGYLGLGLPFAAAVVIGYGVLIGAFIRGIRTRRRYRSIPTMGLSALVLVSLHSLVDFSLEIPGVGVYFAAVTAAAVSVSLTR